MIFMNPALKLIKDNKIITQSICS
ncbi:hypothetical protein KQQSB11_250094 [Klebsiella quasipneumoniae subsp. quasipneumoniae]|nr:hypothetical protein KQQSB11_250094 [Klebsiella quasipneumoniae subsp. quasipneumoniae]